MSKLVGLIWHSLIFYTQNALSIEGIRYSLKKSRHGLRSVQFHLLFFFFWLRANCKSSGLNFVGGQTGHHSCRGTCTTAKQISHPLTLHSWRQRRTKWWRRRSLPQQRVTDTEPRMHCKYVGFKAADKTLAQHNAGKEDARTGSMVGRRD